MLRNLTPGIRDLLPSLMGGAESKIDDEFPTSEFLRTACAQDGTLSTYVIPATFPEGMHSWFSPELPTYPLREDNEVEWYIDGESTYEAMVEAIETATGPDHFIVLLGWAAYLDFPLSERGFRTASAKKTLGQILKERTLAGVRVRILLWENRLDRDANGIPSFLRAKVTADLWNLSAPAQFPRRSITIVDDATRDRGAHHQKVLLVKGDRGLVGFVGGVDFNPDRVKNEKVRVVVGPAFVDTSGPLHDVHARLLGSAAEDLLVLAANRWNFAHPADPKWTGNPFSLPDPGLPPGTTQLPSSGREIEDLALLLSEARAAKLPAPEPHHLVQIAQTVGNPELKRFQYVNGVRPMIEHAIRRARRFIYIEDQYFWTKQAIVALLDALPVVRHVTVLVPPDAVQSPLYRPRHYALRFLKQKAGGNLHKIRLYERTGVEHRYIHAKMSIYDDEFAIIGSANWNDRGFYHDSEVIAGIAERNWASQTSSRGGNWHTLEVDLARKLRMSLWAEHLRIAPDRLSDGVAAEYYWRHPPASATIQEYKIGSVEWHQAKLDDLHYEDGDWEDEIWDPYDRA